MKVYRIYNPDFTYYYIITNDILRYTTVGSFTVEISIDELKSDIEFIDGTENQ